MKVGAVTVNVTSYDVRELYVHTWTHVTAAAAVNYSGHTKLMAFAYYHHDTVQSIAVKHYEKDHEGT